MVSTYRSNERQLWLPIPVIPTKVYYIIERINEDYIKHRFESLTDAVTYVVVHGRVREVDGKQLEEWLLSGREWATSRRNFAGSTVTRHWRLTTETKR